MSTFELLTEHVATQILRIVSFSSRFVNYLTIMQLCGPRLRQWLRLSLPELQKNVFVAKILMVISQIDVTVNHLIWNWYQFGNDSKCLRVRVRFKF